MNYVLPILVVLLFIGCKENSEKDPTTPQNPQEKLTFEQVLPFDTIFPVNDAELEKTLSIELKRKQLIEKTDDKAELQDLVIPKSFKKDEDLYLIDFNYPYLNESLKPSYVNFNEYMEETYLNLNRVEAEILEDKELFCDTLFINRFKEQRLVDYKVYNLNENLISVLMYKENYYSGTLHPSYTFDCLNFSLDRSVFMCYEDFFNQGSEEEMTRLLNETLREQLARGDIYYACWEISFDDFFDYKNNFVIDDNKVEYYFDDCVICPSYTGTYSVEIPLVKLLPVLKKYDHNPLIM